jgi:hypothetical protein
MRRDGIIASAAVSSTVDRKLRRQAFDRERRAGSLRIAGRDEQRRILRDLGREARGQRDVHGDPRVTGHRRGRGDRRRAAPAAAWRSSMPFSSRARTSGVALIGQHVAEAFPGQRRLVAPEGGEGAVEHRAPRGGVELERTFEHPPCPARAVLRRPAARVLRPCS